MNNPEFLKKKLTFDGFVIVPGFFNNCKKFNKFKKYINRITYKVSNSDKKNQKLVDKKISEIFSKNKKISGYLNDNINLSPYLFELFTSHKLLDLISKLFSTKKEDIAVNNQRFRIQIPGNDRIANLPWHQDVHYNNVKRENSVAAWISINDVSKKMGPLIFKKKSHIYGTLKSQIFKKPNGGKAYTVNIKDKKLKQLKNYCKQTKSGDLILIDMNLVHRSNYNKTKYSIKYSAQARYHLIKDFNE